MNFLTKFDAVEVKAEQRISSQDQHFCEIHQAAYDNARQSFQELVYFCEDICQAQRKILADTSEPRAETIYLRTENHGVISADSLQPHTASLHSSFIRNIVSYFNRQYHVSAEAAVIEENLLPQDQRKRQHRYGKELQQQYEDAIKKLALRYETVLEQIFVQLGGRDFAEQALFELKKQCHNAAWNSYHKTPDYELKNSTICFSRYSCTYDDQYCQGRWELSKSMQEILFGLAHFETGSFSSYPNGFFDLLRYNRSDTDIILFSTCEKLCQLKMFKNRRVDIKFTNTTYARQFVTDYLGLTAGEVLS